MKATVYSIKGEKVKQIDLPIQFEEEYRPNIIRRAFLVIRSHLRQPYGAKPKAGQRSSAVLSRRRRDYKTSYGHGLSRIPRKTIWRRGRQFGWVGAFSPGTVGGRKAHPPKAEKIQELKINKKERKKAIRSAIAATANPVLVKERNPTLSLNLPIIVESEFEKINKTKEAKKVLENLGLKKELERTEKKKIRAGKGKMRNRKYKKKVGPLIVVSYDCPLLKAAPNIPGVDICPINSLNALLLAPGSKPGRLTIYTESAIENLRTKKLFLS